MVWTGEIPAGFAAWKDDETTPALDGYQNPRDISFRFWDRSENEEIRQFGTRTASANQQYDGSIWVGTLTFDGPISRPEIPQVFKLGPIFPNPFNSTAIIHFDIPHSENICLRVHDNQGRHLTTLYQDFMEAGSHNLTINLVNYPSGVYIVILQSNTTIKTEKMEILK